MTREEKAIHGILYADGSYDSLPVYYLSREWEYYPDVLLTPGDDLEKYYFRYLSIGEYGGMELDDRNGNPYGSGTYRASDHASLRRAYLWPVSAGDIFCI